jgi:hypothetical protein
MTIAKLPMMRRLPLINVFLTVVVVACGEGGQGSDDGAPSKDGGPSGPHAGSGGAGGADADSGTSKVPCGDAGVEGCRDSVGPDGVCLAGYCDEVPPDACEPGGCAPGQACARVVESCDGCPHDTACLPVLLCEYVSGADWECLEGTQSADEGDGGCDEELAKALLATCIVPDAVNGTPAMWRANGDINVDMLQTVMELGVGAPPDGCFVEYPTLGAGFSSDSPELAEARWLRTRAEDGLESVVGVLAPSFEWPVDVGDEVNVAYRRVFGDFSPTVGRLELRGSDGELLVWLGFAGSVEELELPSELVLTQGAEACRVHSQCVSEWTQHELAVELDGEKPTVGYGERTLVGDFWVTHGGVDVQQGASTCSDAFVGWAAAGVWRTQ